MFLLDDRLVFGAGDLTRAASCEFAVLRNLDSTLGRLPRPDTEPDAMLDRVAALGGRHEQRVLDRFRAQVGAEKVVEIARPEYTAQALTEAAQATLDAVRAGAPVVYQGAFFDTGSSDTAPDPLGMIGFSDFLVLEDDGYAVYDSKLSRHAKVEALLQLAAYADALARTGTPVSSHAHLVLGDGSIASYPLAEIMPVYRHRRACLETLLTSHRAAPGPVRWGAGGHTACGRCDDCTPELERHRDLLLVAGMRSTQRLRLIEAGVSTIDDLAACAAPVDGMARRTFDALRAQARAQLEEGRRDSPYAEVYDATPLGILPAPDEGDIFFDFEGDPLWSEGGSSEWGLEYLFGVVEGPADAPIFRPFWAHDREQERQALLDFLDYVTDRRRRHPRMHVYHYAPYEKTALLRLAGRYGVGEEIVDDLLREGVLVDLYPVVRNSIRVGARTYGLKKLEPLYTEESEARDGDVADAGASIVAYADYCALRDAGHLEEAERELASIASYNEADCISTLRLRDWLLTHARDHGISPTETTHDEAAPDAQAHPVETKLLEYVGGALAGDRTPEQQAAALVAAAMGYHRRERKPFWWGHFDRLATAPDEWADARDTLVAATCTLETDWHKATPRRRLLRRRLRLAGEFEPGSTLRAGQDVFLLYDAPGPDGLPDGGTGTRAWSRGVVVERTTGTDHPDVLVVDESLRTYEEYSVLPVAVTPGAPISSKNIEAAIASAAEAMCSELPALPSTAAVDVLRRIPPRLRSGAALPPLGDDAAGTIVTTVLNLENSYLAVQGPPGTGKTYTGARVVASLVNEHGWRVGVVAQSHSVVENMLAGIVAAGVPGERVAKAKCQNPEPTWAAFPDAKSLAAHIGTSTAGYVVGGTAWDFTNPNCIAPGSLDLLVIDEAGQFCLANTIAVATAASNLLLLGDPRQLPQVSQGTHPEPVDESALGWLAEGHGALPADRGYFLPVTWRMHPDLCARVSELSYEGRLQSKSEITTRRALDGVPPGVRLVEVAHEGNATCSPEESAEIVRAIAAVLGSAWTDDAGSPPRPLGEEDVLVVAPYNAQVTRLRQDLAAAGLHRVQVGTVDKFQGRQAAMVFVSMTASAVEDVPRGMSFLLSRNRSNVALSRGKWSAVIVRSGALTDHLPSTPDGLIELGAFMRLTGADPTGA
ncbi:TM0106 family RecB-like putative nuclease [Rhodococcus pyridinivorans]|uniref:TM0106 family RecB-like putative nuclease n=1 Tax=Rhodococcus pyridinivorans TaxID=103816 RepID=A0A7M2XJP7_9NOCA|nr:bifunctional RecB family nuclease/DEAD/DEAH box helicase [Rhodococcus pyridinivorans]QOV97945.1 TM0106 family RecB-like putative nuclease [Rhodococcus pyridinivorans]